MGGCFRITSTSGSSLEGWLKVADTAIEMTAMRKAFENVVAVDNVDFSVRRGEIHALVGENGAGKTTLMNLLYGIYRPDHGTIKVFGQQCNIEHARQAIALGIGMVHQHFMLLPPLTIAENLVLGKEPRTQHRVLLDYDKAVELASELSQLYGLGIEPKERVIDVSVGEQQRVEILKALYRGAEILILDEPTAVLTPQESGDLFKVLRSLKSAGKTIIFISHKLREVMEIADRVTVMRHGRIVDTVSKEETDVEALAKMMVGRKVSFQRKEIEPALGDVVLSVRDLEARGARGLSALKGISFDIHSGEILGVAGVDGNGQSELVEVITGLRRADSGRVVFRGQSIINLSPADIRTLGISHVPEDRHRRGICKGLTVEENLIAGGHRSARFSRLGRLQAKTIRAFAEGLVSEFDIRPDDPTARAGNLSGGNAQKVVVAREVSTEPSLLVASQPTRGLDVGSIEFIRKVLIAQQQKGQAILLVSADLEEILSLSDRIAVMYEGRFTGILRAEDATETRLGLLMAGITEGDEAVVEACRYGGGEDE